MKESYCGLCDACQLDNPEFLQAVAQVKSFVDRFRVYWWAHCYRGDEGFSLPEFRKGLEWFLSHAECPGCRGGRGLDHCPIRICAINRGCEHCFECPELAQCDRFRLILKEYPDHKRHLLGLQEARQTGKSRRVSSGKGR
ncbi:MAG: DUF3795 domain-containing protein [Syntrophobacterales bacterium]|nr:DUF3795 domain-containing protein [Syntrophobacterales bacterium]